MLLPGEYHAGTSPLIRMLRERHHNVRLSDEAWDRLITWIDLNAPCHGSWDRVYPVPRKGDERRRRYRRLYAHAEENREKVEQLADVYLGSTVVPDPLPPAALPPDVPDWPFDATTAGSRQDALGTRERKTDLGGGVTMALAHIPAGEFAMGGLGASTRGKAPVRTRIDEPFWIGTCEVTNAQFARFDPEHDSGHARRLRVQSTERQTRPLNRPDQPVVRVSWDRAAAFCDWLSDRTGLRVTLPSEAQWEYACRAGTDTPFWWGDVGPSATACANMGGKEIWAGGDRRFKDSAIVSADVGSLKPNPWGLHDMHGNVAEWTATGGDRRIVRGGSFFDRADWCRSGTRTSYPHWQRVYNVGFRIAATAGRPPP